MSERFRIINALFVPPNPKLLLSTVFTSVSTVVAVRFRRSAYSSGCSKLMLGATK